MRPVIRISRVCAALALALTLLAIPFAVRAESDKPIMVGAIMPMTGAVAAYGQMCWKGIEIAHQMKPQVAGRPVKLILVDNKSDAVEAANAASRLIKKDNVVAILGPVTSTRSLSAVPIAEEAKIPLISPAATNATITQNRKYAFRVCFIDPFQGQVAARYAYNNLGSRRAAILIDVAQDYCVALGRFFMREFKRLGGEIVSVAKCNTNDQDFSAQLGTIKAAKPDLLYLPNYYTEDALVARQAREAGLKVTMLSGDGAQAPELIKIGGPDVEGFSFTAHFHPKGAARPVAKDFVARYGKLKQQGELKEDLTGFHALGADAYLVLVDAMERAGSLEGEKLREALASTKGFSGVTGMINIGPDGNAIKSATILQVKEGQFDYVTTIEP